MFQSGEKINTETIRSSRYPLLLPSQIRFMATFDLSTLEGCRTFAHQSEPATIARQILQDQQQCREGGLPSLLVYCLPTRTDGIALEINEISDIPLSIARMRLSSIVSVIKNHLATLSRPISPERIPAHLVPSDGEYDAALKVLRYLQIPQTMMDVHPSTRISAVEETIQTQLLHGSNYRKTAADSRRGTKYCYVCMFKMYKSHRLYPSLCNPCGEFNISSSSLSLPDKLDLSGKTSLITGGRVNLGYHTALRLLRCGTKVVVSSRYPLDAEARYLEEPDFPTWKNRLKVVGADFRSAKDVFGLVDSVLDCLRKWSVDGTTKLDILINNAAQTLTDLVDREEEQIRRESSLQSEKRHLLEGAYTPRVRGGVVGYQLESSASKPDIDSKVLPGNMHSSTLITAKDVSASSWVQHISEIPYEDVISAHSVNTFVPFILVRELLPYMGKPHSTSSETNLNGNSTSSSSRIPQGYIINVSSREGLFESKPGHGSKNGHHVHTNMSKAALNMLTETEAAPAWKKHCVAMNTVDPGYMSADPVFMEMVGRSDQECPIGWEDGAGRILWPIAKGEHGETVHGRFLKHFTTLEVVR
ncbi:dehydrogenase [Crepidotus variabilis]|uniref:Dehydrogenase n=1 Tax=Crepidotus variabilis TaxID=179855 RepID=A0A9P6EQL0_9AGAR|nr:dehydrogenase [Crepidotus variabilis]